MAISFNGAFTFFLDPIPALALMISVGASSIFAGDIPGALLNIPGTPASATYTNDAHTLVKEGKTNRVLWDVINKLRYWWGDRHNYFERQPLRC